MILIDYNQMIIANFMQFQKMFKPGQETNMLRHMVMNSIKMINNKFKNDWGELVFCCDGTNNWRKNVFEYYKANRKKQREENPQKIDWQALFDALNDIKQELRDYMPYKVIDGDGCEADDIIAVICKKYHYDDKILIISGDKDFIQLQKYPGIAQWSPIKKKFLKNDNPVKFKYELIIQGDRIDGIPNILSADDTFVSEKRQNKLSKKKLNEWSNVDPETILEGEALRNYKRNQQLIDLDCIPSNIQESINSRYLEKHFTGRDRMLNYFIKHRLREMTESLQEF